jgi:hypothetical protein
VELGGFRDRILVDGGDGGPLTDCASAQATGTHTAITLTSFGLLLADYSDD